MTEHQSAYDAPWVDELRSVDLADAGLPGYSACTLVACSGDEWMVLIHDGSLDTPASCQPSDWREVAPHELTGCLPRAYAPRCGRRASTSGKPCRVVVFRYGEACPTHQHIADHESQHEHA
jgi:hypothetical protein